VIAVIALIGLSVSERGLWRGLEPRVDLAQSLLLGITVGIACSLLLWMVRWLPPLADLESWQRGMVREWSAGDALAVALFSGVAEEALLRALLQPLIGLVPAALLFAVLHVIPDRRLWLWPVVALALGVALGLLYEGAGYPAAAAAHVSINVFSLLRLRRPRRA
jgi:membrane protease YdiL (CAAX protease family)